MTERQIGNYRILKQIGAGGMAKVYLAVHKDVPNLKVVLKILSSPQHAARFMQEADKLALLERNPNVCHIRHFFTHEDELVIAMEYIDGKSLEEMIVEKGKFSVGETMTVVKDLLNALGAAHEKEIYHRDIKPSNIMFDKDGQLKIIDFGIAKGKTDPQMTIDGTATGTPEYMAPEQFESGEHLDYAKCDIYAVGTMMYRMLTGQLPFTGENQFVLRDKKLFEEPSPPSRLSEEISGELDRLVLKSIDKDPGKRFASISEMKSELQRIAGKPGRSSEATATEAIPAPPATSATVSVSSPGGQRESNRRSRMKIAASVAIAIIIVAAAVIAIVMRSGGDGGNASNRQAGGTVAAPRETPADTQTATAAEPQSEPQRPEPQRVAPLTPPPPNGFLRVTSRPPHAAIYIDNVQRSQRTPYTFELPPGRYSVKMVNVISGIELAHTEVVTIRSGETRKISHAFEE